MKIGVFDSGVGGLNVLKELIRVYPNNHYIYYGDTINVPYGNKSSEELLRLSKEIIHFFEKEQVNLIIIACGTISSNCYNDLLKQTKIKIYDIITPTVKYLNNSSYKNIGIIGTTKTIESKVFERQIINRLVITRDTPDFVPIIEKNQINMNKDNIINELKLFKNKVDCLVLGCTHYPLLKEVISEYLTMPLIDMGQVLTNEIVLKGMGEMKIELYFSLLNDDILANIHQIMTDNNIVIKRI